MNNNWCKDNGKLFFKIIITAILCGSGLIYQSTELIIQYMSGKTLVQIQIERVFNEKLPGITLCYPIFIDPLRVAKVDPDIKILMDKYGKSMDKYLWKKSDNVTEEIIDLGLKFRNLMDKAFPVMESLKLKDVLENLTVQLQSYDSRTRKNSPQLLSLRESNLFMDLGDKAWNKVKQPQRFDEIIREEIIESYQFTGEAFSKCFTLFSHLKKHWRELKMILLSLKLNTDEIIRWIPPHYFKPMWWRDLEDRDMWTVAKMELKFIKLAIHSPNDMPKFTLNDDWHELEFGTAYQIQYSQLSIKRLGYGFDTNCKDYDLDYESGNNNTRSDCIINCFQNKMQKLYQNDGLYYSEFLLRKEHLDLNKTLNETFPQMYSTLGAGDELITEKFKIDCNGLCQNNCVNRIYPSTVIKDNKVYVFDELRHIERLGYSIVEIKHNGMPDIQVTHLPEKTFIDFVCNFGGLLGMWLGLSVWALFDDMTKRFPRLIYKISEDQDQTVQNRSIRRAGGNQLRIARAVIHNKFI